MTAALLVTLATRCLLVALFLPFSALDKIIFYRSAVDQADKICPYRWMAVVLIVCGLAIEVVMSLAVLTGIMDRLAGLVLALYCMATALLWKQFWRVRDFWRAQAALGLFWDFLKNFSLAGGFLLLAFGTSAASAHAFFADPFASSHPYRASIEENLS
jgi:putative oxidoreductase